MTEEMDNQWIEVIRDNVIYPKRRKRREENDNKALMRRKRRTKGHVLSRL
jgi:hypothetical protein